MKRVDGKLTQSPTVNGTVRISAGQVRFLPESPTEEIGESAFSRTAVAFGHRPGATEGRFGTNDEVYLFAFRGICFGCAVGSMPADPAKAAQQEEEFDLFHAALTDFAPVNGRLVELSEQPRIRLKPGSEPDASASAITMGQYAEVNRRLAQVCTEPARSCVLRYATYQGCKAGAAGADCGAVPDCTADVVLPRDFDGKGLTITMPKDSDAGELRPAATCPAVIGAAFVAGSLVDRVQPVYPREAKAMRIGGTVVMRAIISKEGTIKSLSVSNTTNPIFNDAALDAVKQWRYKPFRLNGEPVEVDTTITVNFQLNNPNTPPPGFGPPDWSRPMIPGGPPS